MSARHPKRSAQESSNRGWALGLAGAALLGAAFYNAAQTKRAQAKHPPLGDFITVEGVRLHYVERGVGAPIVLIHGNATMLQDWIVSGLLDALAQFYRVIAFDRPGFGYSERPRSHLWTPAQQAKILAGAIDVLGVKAPVVVGHSLGTQVALALALNHPAAVSRLVLLGGYYFPSSRLDAWLAAPGALPLVGDILNATVAPLWAAAMVPSANRKLFAPALVPAAWTDEFPFGLMLRPSQIHAEAADGAMMVPAAVALSKRYSALALPVTLIAGAGDRIANPVEQSQRLHAMLPQSRLALVEDAGHMVHHTALEAVVAGIAS